MYEIGVKSLVFKCLTEDAHEYGVAVVGVASSFEYYGVAGTESDGDHVDSDVWPGLVDYADDSHRDSHSADFEAIGEFALFDDFATGCREFCDVAGVSGYGGESVGVEFEAVVAVVGGVDFLEVELVGVDDLLCVLDDGVGHGVERVFGL